jgi:hypothetical protein
MARYEDLRRSGREGISSLSGSWGLTLFLRQGLAAWMHAWPRQRGADPPVPEPASPSVPPSALPTSLSGPLVTVLANMVFTARQEALV